MERRNMPLSDPHHSTADLLSWSEIRRPDHSSAATRSNQPSDGVTEALDGCRVTNEETESLNTNVSHRKNCSGHKLKEMNGSDLFSDNGIDEPIHKTINHYHQDQNSQISFSAQENATPKKPATLTEAAKQKEFSRTEEDVTPKKPTSLTEAAKHKELSRTVQTESDSKSKKKQISNSKTKATSGHDIFAYPPRRSLAAAQQEVNGNKNMDESAPRSSRASAKASNGQSEEHVVKSSRKLHNPRFQQLTSNGIFKSDKIPPGYSEKMHSSAKLREMSGHNIFADGKSEYRDYYGGTRRPPGGESSISLS
uniref:Alpha-ketoglutarate-dependent dioxygenase alkB-like protein 2 n=1 Tax=Noccaea caerulescens TaxID=107243 RepID=A0A1J3IPH0_NOCCA